MAMPVLMHQPHEDAMHISVSPCILGLPLQARVEELRQVKEAGLWGRETYVPRDLPAYWSVSTFGQPYNDERLFTGATNFYQIQQPATLNEKDSKVVGPATEQLATLRK